MEQSKALAALSALAHSDRLDLIRLLVPLQDEGMAAGQIARALGLSASRLSFHLSQLEAAGLIRSRRVARNVIYAVDARGLGSVISYLLSDCCGDHPEVLAFCPRTNRSSALPPAEALCCPDPGGVPMLKAQILAAES
ncbi:ArsR/SmtB family transcription factor [Pseudogemmobacter faecipullorum]|uniref:Helix-turn-helix transcriptional regulator n=1 Tax=Pseudogemmobacter faecipullorum TaxID=2755041 RepID=A0ABS8CKP3_9RHOB|nr:helix-turn-helix domain-containing protein [Pseudogemmobacter faecipullorum]MCB5409966.1 helix-turn-helix transcriptional regulator [Pseudogemmobacter faecipullorum]